MRFVFRRTLLATLAAVAALVTHTPVANATASAGHPEAPQEFVALRDVAPTIIEEIRYHGSHNFVGRPVTGYREPLCIVTRPTALALREAQRRLLPQGYTLKVYDCFRPQRAVDSFVRWARRLDDDRMKNEFYPRVEKSSLFEDGYIAEHSGHSRGSTVDLTLVRIPPHPQEHYRPGDPLRPCFAPAGERFGDNSVDMGTGFDCFDTLSHTDDPRITGEAMRNRALLKDTLEAVGMENYPNEWWHYTLRDEPFPDTYFDFPVARRSLNG